MGYIHHGELFYLTTSPLPHTKPCCVQFTLLSSSVSRACSMTCQRFLLFQPCCAVATVSRGNPDGPGEERLQDLCVQKSEIPHSGFSDAIIILMMALYMYNMWPTGVLLSRYSLQTRSMHGCTGPISCLPSVVGSLGLKKGVKHTFRHLANMAGSGFHWLIHSLRLGWCRWLLCCRRATQ